MRPGRRACGSIDSRSGSRCCAPTASNVRSVDAAHILPDGHPRGAPIVPNGLALCTLHHAAFDRHVLGVRHDLRVEIRLDVLEEEDGPMLEHGLQGFHGGGGDPLNGWAFVDQAQAGLQQRIVGRHASSTT